MIGVVGELTLQAFQLGLMMGRAELAKTQQEYEPLRAGIAETLLEMELGDLDVPETLPEYGAASEEIVGRVIPYLSARRGTLLGDTAALPVFFVSFFVIRTAAAMAFSLPLDEAGEVVETALEDLGLGRDFLRNLERDAGFLAVDAEDEDAIVSIGAINVVALSFLREVLEALVEESDADELRSLVKDLGREVRDFRAEFREQTAELEQLVRDGNAAVLSAIDDVRDLLVANGMEPTEARALTEGDPASFWDRIVRWFGGAGPRDAAEAAFWVALDFVPGGPA